MLPDYDIRRHTVFAIVEEHDPVDRRQYESSIAHLGWVYGKHIHSIWVHRFAGIKVVIAKVGHDLFSVVSLHTLLEILDERLVLASFLELLHHLFQIP